MKPAPNYPYEFMDHIIITEEEIRQSVKTLGEQITDEYKDSEKLVLLGLLRGSVMFITDLMRQS